MRVFKSAVCHSAVVVRAGKYARRSKMHDTLHIEFFIYIYVYFRYSPLF